MNSSHNLPSTVPSSLLLQAEQRIKELERELLLLGNYARVWNYVPYRMAEQAVLVAIGDTEPEAPFSDLEAFHSDREAA